MVRVSMMLSVADCFDIGVVARHMIGLVTGIRLSGITRQLTRLLVTTASATMTELIMGWVTILGLVSASRRGYAAVRCLRALTTFIKYWVGSGNATAKAEPAGSAWYVLLLVGLPLLAPEAVFWLLHQGSV